MAEISIINVLAKECLDTNAMNNASKEDNMNAETVLLEHGSSKNQRYNNEMSVLRQRLPSSRLSNTLNTDMDIELISTNCKNDVEVLTSFDETNLENQLGNKETDKGRKLNERLYNYNLK